MALNFPLLIKPGELSNLRDFARLPTSHTNLRKSADFRTFRKTTLDLEACNSALTPKSKLRTFNFKVLRQKF